MSSADVPTTNPSSGPRPPRSSSTGSTRSPPSTVTPGPLDLFRIQFGGANTFATVILGTFPILLGLSLWEAVAATVLGVLVGALILMPMGLFGPLTGTNNAVSSGAHFGVRGRVLGSFLSLLTAIAFYSISVWVSGDALVGALIRLFGSLRLRPSARRHLRRARRAGHRRGGLRLRVHAAGQQGRGRRQHRPDPAGRASPTPADIDLGFDPGPDAYALGSFWPTFVLSALIVMGNPISFGAFLGDWSRYIPERTSARSLLLATLGAQAATLVPFLFGVVTATLVAGEADYIVGADQRVAAVVRRPADGGRVPRRPVHRASPRCTAPGWTSRRCSRGSAGCRRRCSSARSRSSSSWSGGSPST